MQKKLFLGSALALAVFASAGTVAFAAEDASPTKTQWEQRKQEAQSSRTAIETAIESGDFAAFQKAVAADPHAQKVFAGITAENFPKLQELHAAQKKVESLRAELGLPDGPHGGDKSSWHHGHGQRHGYEKGLPAGTTATQPATQN